MDQSKGSRVNKVEYQDLLNEISILAKRAKKELPEYENAIADIEMRETLESLDLQFVDGAILIYKIYTDEVVREFNLSDLVHSYFENDPLPDDVEALAATAELLRGLANECEEEAKKSTRQQPMPTAETKDHTFSSQDGAPI